MGSLRDRKVACSVLDRQGSNFESCVWRTVSSLSSHHPQEVLLAQFSLYVHLLRRLQQIKVTWAQSSMLNIVFLARATLYCLQLFDWNYCKLNLYYTSSFVHIIYDRNIACFTLVTCVSHFFRLRLLYCCITKKQETLNQC